MGIFSKLKQAWFGDVNWEKLDDEFFDNLEESLILADVGVNIATEAVNSLRNAVFSYDMKDPEQVKAELRKILLQKLSVGDAALDTAKSPTVILVIGVNGVGKTTSIGKLAAPAERRRGKRSSSAQGTPSGPLPPTSWRFGQTGPGCPLCASMRGRTRERCCLMHCRQPRLGIWMWSCAILPVGCTISRT